MKYIPKFQREQIITKHQKGKKLSKAPSYTDYNGVMTPLNFPSFVEKRIILPVATNAIIGLEGFRERPYKVNGDKVTIGSGLTDPKYIKKGFITPEENYIAVQEHIQKEVLPHLYSKPYYNNLAPEQKVSAISLIYNAGSGNFNTNMPKLQKALTQGNKKEIIKNWDFGWNQTGFGGLRERRIKEQQAFKK